jgi:hypothetical protein
MIAYVWKTKILADTLYKEGNGGTFEKMRGVILNCRPKTEPWLACLHFYYLQHINGASVVPTLNFISKWFDDSLTDEYFEFHLFELQRRHG